MERQMTARAPGITLAPRLNTRLLGQIGAVAGVGALVLALVFVGSNDGAGVETTPADLLRWQAAAASFDGASPAALAAESARLSGIASAYTALSDGQAASAARWAGIAEVHSELDRGQAAYAARSAASSK